MQSGIASRLRQFATSRLRSFSAVAGPLEPPAENLAFAFTASPLYCFQPGPAPGLEGEPIEAWYDRTGTVFHEQTSTASQPILVLSGGQYWVEADGADDVMAAPVAMNIGDYDASGLTIYWRSIYTGALADAFRWLVAHYLGEGWRWFIGKTDATGTLHTALPGLSGYSSAARTGAAVVVDADEKWCMTYTPGGTVTLHRNGTLVNTSGAVGSTLETFRACLFAAAGTEAGGGSQFWKGRLRHLWLYSGSHNATQRAEVLAALDY